MLYVHYIQGDKDANLRFGFNSKSNKVTVSILTNAQRGSASAVTVEYADFMNASDSLQSAFRALKTLEDTEREYKHHLLAS